MTDLFQPVKRMFKMLFLLLCFGVMLPLTVVLTAWSAPGDLIFTAGPSLGIGQTEEAFAEDFNGDGLVDIFTADTTSYIWINNGNQTFTSGHAFDERADGAAVGDLNGDDALDVIFALPLEGVPVWLGDGQGQFTDSGQLLVTDPGQTLAVAVGDVDGDDDLDIFIGTTRGGQVWLNGENGDPAGTFRNSGQDLGGQYGGTVKLVDLDGDDDLDAVVADNGTSFQSGLWFNDGEGTFTEGGAVSGFGFDEDVAVGDVDNDGDVDLLFATFGEANSLWINQGGQQGGTAGEFMMSPQEFYPTGSSLSVDFGDVDGDGDQDAVFGTRFDSENGVWLNQGGAQGGAIGQFVNSGEQFEVNGDNHDTYETLLADLDGDNSLDVVFGNNGTDRVFWNGFVVEPTADLSLVSCCSGVGEVPDSSTALTAIFEYTLTNLGPDVAHNVVVDFTDQSAYLSSQLFPSKGTCSGPERICMIETLAVGEAVQINSQISKLPTFGIYVGTITEYAQALADEIDPTDNFATNTRDFYNCKSDCALESIFCDLSFNRSAMGILDRVVQTAENGYVPDLLLYYEVRDAVMLPRQDGGQLSDIYNAHNLEIYDLMVADETLWDNGMTTLELWEPNLQAVVDGDGETAVITSEQIAAMDAFLTGISAVGSPDLRQAIDETRASLPSLEDFVGMTMDEAADEVLGPVIIYLPMIERGGG